LYVAPYIPVIRQHSSAKIALRAHNVEWEIWARVAEREANIIKRFYIWVLARRIKQMEKRALRIIDLLVPITQRDARHLPFSSSDKVHVSPTGVESSKFAQKPVNHNFSLFHIGSLDWIPNQEGLLWFINKVWVPLKMDYPEWEFFIAGRNASKAFEDKLTRLPVKFMGEVPDAAQFIDDYDVMVVPLFSGSGMRIKIIEAMARGKCVVTTTIGKEGIPAKENHEIFVADNANEMKHVIAMLMENASKIEECSKKAFTFAQKNYNNQLMVKKLEQFYLKQK
jgi:glycosyltransferase involved in cell wall biosynthesis